MPVTIAAMKEPTFTLPVQIRTDPKAKLAFDRIVAAVRASEGIRWKGRRVTQEAVFAAICLWLEDLGEDFVIEAMSRYIPRLEAIMRGETPAAASYRQNEPDAPPPPSRRKRSG